MMMFKRKREREILHNYLEVLAKNYTQIEAEHWSASAVKIYDRLNPAFKGVKPCLWLFSANLFVCFLILLKKLFRG